VETFCPKLRERRCHTHTNVPTHVTKHLFPRYIFARFDADRLLHKVCFTRGVHSVVSFGGLPAPIGDELIALIKERASEDGLPRIREAFRPGDKVVIKNGHLQDFAGIFEYEMKDCDRVMILLDTVKYQCRTVVAWEQLRKAG
jgi:transcriptional antiterminator RfaH